MFKLTAVVFRALVVASLCGSAVACTAELQVPEGLGSKVSDALGTKKGHDGGTSGGSDASVPPAHGDAGVVVLPDASAGDSGTDDYADASVWGDDDSSDAGVWGDDDGVDASAGR